MGKIFSKLSFRPNFNKLIGEGGCGDIYKCKDNPKIVIKLIKAELSSGETNKKIIEISQQSKHLMTIYGHMQIGQINYVAMEYLHGKDLFDYLEDIHPLPKKKIIKILGQTLKGLTVLHQNDIMHRDIKLDNLFFNPHTQTVKIVDFGLSHTGSLAEDAVGTAGYFAPEMTWKRPYDNKCDIWSLGIVLYKMVCNRELFSDEKDLYMGQLSKRTKINFNDIYWYDKKDLKYLCSLMLLYYPNKRPSSQGCLMFLRKK